MPYGPMFYDEDTVTDQPQRQIVAEIIREKALHALDEEDPSWYRCNHREDAGEKGSAYCRYRGNNYL